MPTAVISGQSGFLGSHLETVLLSKGYKVSRITQELLYNPTELNLFFRQEQPDYIYHFASFGNMAHQTDIPMTVFANYIGTFNMLKESIDIPYRAFIFASSSSVYGTKYDPMRETDLPLPDTFYGAAKLGAEYLCRAFIKQYQKPIMVARLFSVYGPGEADFRFIPTVINSILSNKPFSVDPKANHDWIYILDCIDALMLIADKVSTLQDRVINIGTGRQHTNTDICEMIKKIANKGYVATIIRNMRKNDSEVWVSDNSYLQRLGWFPKVMLEDGLKACWEYYEKAQNTG